MKVFVVVVSFNGMKWIENCLSSILTSSIPAEVIVVDNASTDGTVEYIKSNFKTIVLLEQGENAGFGKANNIGVKYALKAGAEHVFLLNQDAYLVKDVLEQLLRFQKIHNEYGILSPIHLTGDQQKLDRNFSNYMLQEKTNQFYSDFVLSNPIQAVYEVPFVNAAAWLISKKCLETVGGFDPLFFHYGEDDNYCQRVQFHGFKIGVLPKVYAIHDREERIHEKVEVFSEIYFKNIEKHHKVRYANINVANNIDVKIKKLKKTIFKLQLKLKFERAADFKKELSILLRIKPLIEQSRDLNKQPGAHYL